MVIYAILTLMKDGAPGAGYTIVETMIFLAVSGALFISAMLLVNGQQQKAQFSQATRDFDSKMQDIMNNIATGYYTNIGVSCQGHTGPPPTPPTLSGGTLNQQGQNLDCIYVGQVIQFAPNNLRDSGLRIYDIAGNKLASPGKESASLFETKPVVIAPGQAPSSIPNSFEDFTLSGGLTIKKVTYDNGAGLQPVGELGFITSFASYSGGIIQSGSATTKADILAIGPSDPVTNDLGANSKVIVDYLNGTLRNPTPGVYNPSRGVKICLQSGGTNQVAIETIGGASTEVNSQTKVDIYDNAAKANAAMPQVCP